MSDESGTSFDVKSVRSGLILLAAPLFGYALVFAYESGFCSLYQIPVGLISLSLTTALVAAAGIALFFGLYGGYVLNMLWGVRLADDQTQDEIKAKNNTIFITTLAVVSIAMVRTLNFAVLIALGFLFWLIANLAIKIKTALLRHPQEPEKGKSILDFSLLRKAMVIGSLVALGLCCIYAWGRSAAKTEPRYLMHFGGSDYVVLRIYGDNAIAGLADYAGTSEIKAKTIYVQAALRIFKLGDSGTPTMHSRRSDQVIAPESMKPVASGFWTRVIHFIYPYED